MKKLIILFTATITSVVCLGSCGRTQTTKPPQTSINTSQVETSNQESNDRLNDWQKEVLAAEGLPTEADELTYCLHVLIRYEMEKAFINGEITVDEIPDVWNAKYREYLGVEVPNDTEGCLQDVHWSGWDYGYFPSYALGSAYGAQILRRMEKDFDVFEEVRKGNLIKISRWLIDNVFSIASLSTPDEWIRAITGESLNTDYFLDYLEEKFTALYQLS